jgi:hypothetical protein
MIRIFTKDNNIEINVIKNTLKIRTENDAFSTDVKVYHNKYPFLISEDLNTITGLGNRHLLSVGRNKITEVIVQFNKKTFAGKLNILEYVTGARKCDLRFGSDLLSISDKKIADFMPTHYFNGVIPYTETVSEYFEQSDFIQNIEDFTAKQYPEVNFQMPNLFVTDYYTEDKDLYDVDHSFNYRSFLTDKKFILNSRNLVFLNFYRVLNKSSFVPMPYLMALLELPLASIGWKLKGDYKDDPLNSKIIVIPDVNNNTLLKLNEGFVFNLLDFGGWINIYPNPPVLTTLLNFSQFIIGTHTLKIDFKKIPKPSNGLVWLKVFQRKMNNTEGLEDIILLDQPNLAPINKADFSSEVEIKVDANSANDNLYMSYSHPNFQFPEEHNFTIESSNYEPKDMILFHPTVELNRFVPDWTFIELINNLKEFQNLKSTIDETTKTLTLNYNQKFITDFNFVNLTEDAVRITGFKNTDNSEYQIIYADETPSEEEGVKVIQNKFKTDYTTISNFQKEGVTLALYDLGIFATSAINEKTLLLDKSNNSLYHLNFKDWISFLNNASAITAEAYLSHTKITEIEEKQKIYFDSILYAVKDMVYDIGDQLNKVTFELRNVIGVSSSNQSLIVAKSIVINSLDLIAPNGLFGSFYWSITSKYSVAGFNLFNGTVTAKQLIQNPNLGVVYSGTEITDGNVLISGQKELYIPFGNYDGWYEVQINYDGVFSNNMYLEVDTVPDEIPQRITLTKILKSEDFLNIKGYFSVSFDGISPAEITLSLQEVQLGTGMPIGAPITSIISDFASSEHEIASPYSGSWTLKATAGTDFSNSIGWLAIIV